MLINAYILNIKRTSFYINKIVDEYDIMDIISLDMITIEEKRTKEARFYCIQYVLYRLNNAIIYKIVYEHYIFFVLYVRRWEKYAFMSKWIVHSYYYNECVDEKSLIKNEHSQVKWMTIDELTNYLRSLQTG